jgi:Uma2 family endonuclease
MSDDRARVRELLVLRGEPAPDADAVEPDVVFEVLSSSTALTDLRVKPEEYAAVSSLMAYVILSQDGPAGATILRRSNGWAPEPLTDTLSLAEIGVTIALDELYRT